MKINITFKKYMLITPKNAGTGDKIFCHTSCIMIGTNITAATRGKTYVIRSVELGDEGFKIIDDQNNIHRFGYDIANQWFCIKREEKEKAE